MRKTMKTHSKLENGLARLLADSLISLLIRESGTYFNSPPVAEQFRGRTFNFDSTNQNWVGFVGYDHQITHNFLIGGEFGVVFAGTADKGETLGVSYTITVDKGYYIRSRFGWLPHEDVLLYINLGSGSYDGKAELESQGNMTHGEFQFQDLKRVWELNT